MYIWKRPDLDLKSSQFLICLPINFTFSDIIKCYMLNSNPVYVVGEKCTHQVCAFHNMVDGTFATECFEYSESKKKC